MKLKLIGLCISAVFTFSVSAQEQWDLKKCVEYAKNNNITVKQAIAQLDLSEINTRQAKATKLPTFSGQMNSSFQRGLSENPTTGILQSNEFISFGSGFQSGYSIFSWNSRKYNIASTELFEKANAEGVEKAKNDIALLVANGFLQVMLSKEQVRLSELQLKQSQAQYVNTRKLVDAGSQPELNAIQIEAQVARDSALYLQAKSMVERGLITLKSYLNLDQSLSFDILAPSIENFPVENITDLQPNAVYEVAVINQPLQKQLALRIEANKYQAKSLRGAMLPSLAAFGNLNTRYVSIKSPVFGQLADGPTGEYVIINNVRYNVQAPQFGIINSKRTPFFRQLNNNFGQTVGLSVNFPIFNQYNARSQWDLAKVNTRQAVLLEEQEKINLKTDIYTAYEQAFAALKVYNASLRNVEASQRAMDFTQKRYDIGLLGTLDYITTQNNLFRAKIEALSNHYDYIFKLKVLEFYKGLGLKL